MDKSNLEFKRMKTPAGRRHVIFLNGECRSDLDLKAYLQEEDYLIGVDGGANHIMRLGLWPDEILGDMDSIDGANLSLLKSRSIKCSYHPVDKDQTDLELAINLSVGLQPSEIILANAIGGRVDHLLSNIMVVLREDLRRIPIQFFDGNSLIVCLHGDRGSQLEAACKEGISTRTFKGAPGQVFSLLPITEEVGIERLVGAKWELRDVCLPVASGRGISNVFARETVEICVNHGSLLIVLPDFKASW